MIPTKYKWIETLDPLPRTIYVGIQFYGTQEVVGRGSNRTIINWRDLLNQQGVDIDGFSDDDIPWCGLFVAFVIHARKFNSAEVVSQPLWARNWTSYGIKTTKPSLGDVLVFARNSGGHVGFYIGEDSVCYHVLGGNQSNKVCITRIEKSRLLAARRPPYKTKPISVKPYHLSSSGSISSNEA
jgi:uncharacterized protein (TIGR02594 family)